MPFIVFLFAAVLIFAGLRGQTSNLAKLLANDFTGTNSFAKWMFAIFVIGAIGYVPRLKPVSDAFLGLVIIVILLVNDKNGSGFFTNVSNVLNSSGSGTAQPTTGATTGTSTGSTYLSDPASSLPGLKTLPALPTINSVGAVP